MLRTQSKTHINQNPLLKIENIDKPPIFLIIDVKLDEKDECSTKP
jgi:hypothetical protein